MGVELVFLNVARIVMVPAGPPGTAAWLRVWVSETSVTSPFTVSGLAALSTGMQGENSDVRSSVAVAVMN